MRTLLRPQRFQRPRLSPRYRTLTTRPQRIPTYVRTWKSALPGVQPSTDPSSDPTPVPVAARDALDYAAFKARREALQDTKGLTADRVVARRYAVQRLERCLWLTHTDAGDGKLRSQLWRAYSLAKAHAPDILEMLPQRAWDVLWESQTIRDPRNTYSRAHVEELYRDMLSVGKSATVQQRVAYLWSIFLNGREGEALAESEQTCVELGDSSQVPPELFECRVRMLLLAGKVDRAQETMEMLFELYPAWSPAVMMAVFRACTRSESVEHHELAWSIHKRMKELLGNEATLQDYDSFLAGFLEARNLEHAKQVFHEMVKGGYLACGYSQAQVGEVLSRLHLIYRLGTDIAKATSIALQAITILPKPYHSHLFGDWMKLAVVHKAPEAAGQILDMMFRRGNEPETFHFNLLLRALFRTGQKEHELKGENIAWQMIDKATKAAPEQSQYYAAMDAIAKKAESYRTKAQDTSMPRRIPPADVATFALIMQWHGKRSQWEHVGYLARRMKESEILPNKDIMNVLMDNECRQGNYNKVWEIYSSLTNVPEGSHGVFPNGASFRCLWKTLRLALGDHIAQESSTLPSPRQLLAENVRWWDLVRRRFDVERFRTGLAAQDHGALNSLIMHCFSYTKDLPGSLVAMHALRKHFHIFPSNKAASILQKQVAWVDMQADTNSVRAQYSHSGVHSRKIAQMGEIYHMLMQARFKRVNLTGDQYAYMTEEEIGDLSLNILSEFIRVILKRQHSPEVVEAMIDEAKKDIGLPHLATGDMDAFAVA